jgi:hypothetical protein
LGRPNCSNVGRLSPLSMAVVNSLNSY